MSVKYLNGTADMGKIKISLPKLPKPPTPPSFKPLDKVIEKVKPVMQKVVPKNPKDLVKNISNTVMKINKTLSTQWFLKSVEKNFLGLADKILELQKYHPNELANVYARFGGMNELLAHANRGKGKKLSGAIGEGESGETAQWADTAKASMPIIKMILEFFQKKRNKQPSAEEQQAVALMQQSLSDYNNIIQKPDDTATTDSETTTSEDGNNWLLWTGLGVAAFMLLKPKKSN